MSQFYLGFAIGILSGIAGMFLYEMWRELNRP